MTPIDLFIISVVVMVWIGLALHYATKANHKYEGVARIKAPPRPAKFRRAENWDDMNKRERFKYYANYGDHKVATHAPSTALTKENCKYCSTT